MKKVALDILILGSLGMTIIGNFIGFSYETLSHFAFVLYSIAMVYEVRMVWKGHGRALIGFFSFVLYCLFIYQYTGLLSTGGIVEPKLWWTFHSGVAALAVMLIRDRHNKYICSTN